MSEQTLDRQVRHRLAVLRHAEEMTGNFISPNVLLWPSEHARGLTDVCAGRSWLTTSVV